MEDTLGDVTGEQRRSARALWRSLEVLHDVTYFDPEVHRAVAEAGARGFWMGYFATRLAPMGPVGPEVATAVCFGFSPERPHRALPDAWTFLSPQEAIRVRQEASAASLRRLVPDLDEVAVPEALTTLVAGLEPAGRPLGAANLGVARPDDPVAHLWQLCTTVREHRGDGHVATLVAAGLDGVASNVLTGAVHGQDPELLRGSRSWGAEAWRAATEHLVARGLVTVDGGRVGATDAGRALHAGIEATTDALAWRSYTPTTDEASLRTLVDTVAPWARTLFASGLLPQPNPIGLASD